MYRTDISPSACCLSSEVKNIWCNEWCQRAGRNLLWACELLQETIWRLSVKTREQQTHLRLSKMFLSLYWAISLCLLLFSFLHACHSCCPAMQRLRGRPVRTRTIVWWWCHHCVFFFYSPGSLWLLHPVSSQDLRIHMTWFKPHVLFTIMASMVANGNQDGQSLVLKGVDPETCMIVFKNHWAQVNTNKHTSEEAQTDILGPGACSLIQGRKI